MFEGTNFTLISDVGQDTTFLVRMTDPLLIDVLSPSTYKLKYKKEIKQR